MPEPARPLVVGWGNPLRGDDGVGPRVAAAIGRRLGDAVDVRTPLQLLPELALDIASASHVILVDAAVDQPPGTVRTRRLASQEDPDRSLHDLAPECLLGLAELVAGVAPPSWLVTVGVADAGFGEDLSPPVESAVPVAVATVDALLGEH